jgi:hypothetical protein
MSLYLPKVLARQHLISLSTLTPSYLSVIPKRLNTVKALLLILDLISKHYRSASPVLDPFTKGMVLSSHEIAKIIAMMKVNKLHRPGNLIFSRRLEI